MIQYIFDGPEKDVSIKPHGNSKLDTPFYPTSSSTRKRVQELASQLPPKEVVSVVTQEQGGELTARCIASLPRNRKQVGVPAKFVLMFLL